MILRGTRRRRYVADGKCHSAAQAVNTYCKVFSREDQNYLTSANLEKLLESNNSILKAEISIYLLSTFKGNEDEETFCKKLVHKSISWYWILSRWWGSQAVQFLWDVPLRAPSFSVHRARGGNTHIYLLNECLIILDHNHFLNLCSCVQNIYLPQYFFFGLVYGHNVLFLHSLNERSPEIIFHDLDCSCYRYRMLSPQTSIFPQQAANKGTSSVCRLLLITIFTEVEDLVF